MKEKTVLIALAITAAMLIMMFAGPVQAFEYPNTSLYYPSPGGNVQHDTLTEQFGPRADHVQIIYYSDEVAEFRALSLGQLDVTDWPLTSDYFGSFTGIAPAGPYYNYTVAAINTGPEFGLRNLDMRMNNETQLVSQRGSLILPVPPFPAPVPNPA